MMQQYYGIKKQYPDSIVFFRLGDFYEMFGEDAKLASKILEIALTSREAGPQGRIPMCGVPYHAAEGYLEKLVRSGYKVAICEQLEDPRQAKGVVKRDVIRVVTPGTFIEGNLDGAENQFLVALGSAGESWGLASLDMSTGQFMTVSTDSFLQLSDELRRLKPAEILLTPDFPQKEAVEALAASSGAVISVVEDAPGLARASETLLRHFQVSSLTVFGLRNAPEILAAGLALKYVQDTQRGVLSHIRAVASYKLEEFLQIDGHSSRNLELTQTIREGKKTGSLLGVLDYTVTSMGARLLKSYLEKPLVDLEIIEARHAAVETLVEQTALRLELGQLLDEVYDLERLLSKLVTGRGNARDLRALAASLGKIPAISQLFAEVQTPLLRELVQGLNPLTDFVQLVDSAIVDEPPITLRDGNLIKEGYSPELDKLRQARSSGREWIKNLEAAERERTGIKSLKVGFNRVFGYYIEVTNPNAHLVPEDYQRKQTLANAERYITPELKEQEALVLGADERIKELEYELFLAIREQVLQHVEAIQENARILANLDVFQSLATAAVRHNYVRPRMTQGPTMDIRGGRHPVIEAVERSFVPNDVCFDDKQQVILLTGPNMAGKSTYLRQVALIVIMAQMGSFIPADYGEIGLVDRIFTRIGASDDLSTGQSTFMVEMIETAELLLNATRRSLIVLDELGRGTSTFDGMAIAQAVIEYIHDKVRARTLFSTHFHELTKLEYSLKRLRSYRMEVEERGGEIFFLHRVAPGSTDRSYGINVARMAGVPLAVIKRSMELLEELETRGSGPLQLDLFKTLDYDTSTLETAVSEDLAPSEVEGELLDLDLNSITPLEALQKLVVWQDRLRQKRGGEQNGSD
ncbi:MAG: DNA mismatch repair protein MutS [Limnochordia bacterium]|jgi:DNA mismatch repair protein MutS|nr:DNA mismatch repair protein MutS [Limnochordia bacterium]MDI9464358.1 DNA mismatch repair protein MutS [Bacillota bacterium]HOB39820.1 DNA mismatch repair protein MutS [Limnochordia bacterium]HOK31271.1 DNA mismatch repair protein MutS [Limnochordia bacterium]HOM00124.1 DNA mismatch repair protein MutS [Limnochordia bacterium]